MRLWHLRAPRLTQDPRGGRRSGCWPAAGALAGAAASLHVTAARPGARRPPLQLTFPHADEENEEEVVEAPPALPRPSMVAKLGNLYATEDMGEEKSNTDPSIGPKEDDDEPSKCGCGGGSSGRGRPNARCVNCFLAAAGAAAAGVSAAPRGPLTPHPTYLPPCLPASLRAACRLRRRAAPNRAGGEGRQRRLSPLPRMRTCAFTHPVSDHVITHLPVAVPRQVDDADARHTPAWHMRPPFRACLTTFHAESLHLCVGGAVQVSLSQ